MQPFDIKKQMKLFYLFLLIPFTTACGSNKRFPEKMPADFKIEYHLDGGMINMNRTIILQNGVCSDKGRADDGPDYEHTFTITDITELEGLYADLKKLNAFSIKYKSKGEVMDRGGESIRFTINGKDYNVDNSQSNFISKEDGPAFSKAIGLIIAFAEKHREPAITKGSGYSDPEKLDENKDIDSAIVNKPTVEGGLNQDNIVSDEALLLEKNTGIPPKMPNDFKLTYEMSAGISGGYRKILLQYGSSTDEGKNAGEAKFSKTWINKDLKDFEGLYNDLYKINAFLLKYTTKGTVADRGGEMVKFTINKKEFVVSDKDSDYIKSSDKAAFKKTIGLILAYVDTHK